jgi:hypothetical protein
MDELCFEDGWIHSEVGRRHLFFVQKWGLLDGFALSAEGLVDGGILLEVGRRRVFIVQKWGWVGRLRCGFDPWTSASIWGPGKVPNPDSSTILLLVEIRNLLEILSCASIHPHGNKYQLVREQHMTYFWTASASRFC